MNRDKNNKQLNLSGQFEGYVWMSDEEKPKVYEGDNCLTSLQINDDENPFIVEANLYDADRKKSVSIKYVDGEYLVNQYDVDNDSNGEVREYVSHKMDGRVLIFNELWEPNSIPDPLCCNMPVLQATKLIFCGFKK